MERFSYPNLTALYEESTELLQLVHAESFGYKKDQAEEMDEMKAEAQSQKDGHG